MYLDRFVAQLRDIYHEQGGVFRPDINAVNLIGVRRPNTDQDEFDDHLYMVWKDVKGRNELRVFALTTEPGKKALVSPVNSQGTFMLANGFHRDLWEKGLHKGRYAALTQAGQARGWRDNDRDTQYDFDKSQTFEAWGINLHTTRETEGYFFNSVGNWSHGCQVLKHPNDLHQVLYRCDIDSHTNGTRTWHYLLVDDTDFEAIL